MLTRRENSFAVQINCSNFCV